MSQYDELNGLTDLPGVIHKRFCTFCPEGALGDLVLEEEGIRIPVCNDCRDKILDTGIQSVID